MRQIKHSLEIEKNCHKALAWCTTNRTKLGKGLSPLEFKLRMQEFIGMVESGESVKAMLYAQKNLYKYG